MKTLSPTKATRKCQECGSELLLVEKKVEILEDEYSPVITSIYKCSVKTCQDEIDKKAALHLQMKEEQELARQKRLENMRLNRKYRSQYKTP